MPQPNLDDHLHAELDALASQHRHRACYPLEGASRTYPALAGKPVLSFASNDYLGLSADARLRAAASAAMESQGVGSGASRLVSGDLPAHRSLEAALAAFLGTSSALLFPSGYQTNLGVITALAGREDLLVSDAANHASLIDGCRLSRATVRVYPHLDVAAARAALTGKFRRRFLVTESVFSMDGDLAPLADLAQVAESGDAHLIVDEAHALGVLGPGGRGACAAEAITPGVTIGTLGKALGSAGGFAAGSPALRSILVNRARTFLFTTAPLPAAAAAGEAALSIVSSAEGNGLRDRLRRRLDQLARGLPGTAPRPPAAIVPVILGSDAAALGASHHLRQHGLFVPAIRPPTVPEDTARLRITLSAAHTEDDVETLLAALATLPRP